MNISDLARNDMAGALALYKERLAADTAYPGFVESLLMLQDDSTALLAAIARVGPASSRSMPLPSIRISGTAPNPRS